MNVSDIKSISLCERFLEGLLNDFEDGIITKSEAMKDLADYTILIAKLAREKEDA